MKLQFNPEWFDQNLHQLDPFKNKNIVSKKHLQLNWRVQLYKTYNKHTAYWTPGNTHRLEAPNMPPIVRFCWARPLSGANEGS